MLTVKQEDESRINCFVAIKNISICQINIFHAKRSHEEVHQQ